MGFSGIPDNSVTSAKIAADTIIAADIATGGVDSAELAADAVDAAALGIVTTKGDIISYSTLPLRVGIGANDTVLTAASGEAAGLKWAAAAGGGGLTLLDSGSASAQTAGPALVQATDWTGTYKQYLMVLHMWQDGGSSGTNEIGLRLNNITTGAKYDYVGLMANTPTIEKGAAANQIVIHELDIHPSSFAFWIQGTEESGISTFRLSVGQAWWGNVGDNDGFAATGGSVELPASADLTQIDIFRLSGSRTYAYTYRLYGLESE